MKRAARIIATIIIYEILALLIMIFVSQNGLYPSGSDVMYHVYRGDYVYHSLKMEIYGPYIIRCGITVSN